MGLWHNKSLPISMRKRDYSWPPFSRRGRIIEILHVLASSKQCQEKQEQEKTFRSTSSWPCFDMLQSLLFSLRKYFTQGSGNMVTCLGFCHIFSSFFMNQDLGIYSLVTKSRAHYGAHYCELCYFKHVVFSNVISSFSCHLHFLS